ncbi:hypothetical protein MASR2M66_10160 [Chloroflexota bacterium]
MAKTKTTNTGKKTTSVPRKQAVKLLPSAQKTSSKLRQENTGKYSKLHENEQRTALELTLLNHITRAILESHDLEQFLLELAVNFAKLLHADDCYITGWDQDNNIALPRVTTAKPQPQFADMPSLDEFNITASALEDGHALAVEDVFDSPDINPEIAGKYPARSILGVPLIFREHKLGAALITFNTPHKFTPLEIEQAERIANHIAVAIWNTQQENTNKQQLKQQEILAKIAITLSQTERLGLSNVLDLIVHSARELIPGAQQAVIHLIDKDQSFLIPEAVSGYDKFEGNWGKMQVGKGVAGLAISEGKSIYIPTVRNDPRVINLNPVAKYQSLLVSPIFSGEQKLGTISVQSEKPYAFSQNEINLLSALGQQAAIAIESALLIESTRQALKETNALYRIHQGLAALNMDELLNDAVELLKENFDYYHVQVFTINPETGNFLLKAASGEIGKELVQAGHELRAGAGIIGYAAETGIPFFANNVDEVVFFAYDPYLPHTKAEMAIPIKNGETLYGILDIQQAGSNSLTQRDQQLVVTVADQLALALHKVELYENLRIALEQEKAIRNQLVQNERLTVMGRLLASVSHELNNPLQAIQNALFLLKEEKGISQQGRNDLEIVLAESERMASLIDRLRATYRPAQVEDLEATYINSIIEDVFALLAPHLRKNEVTFEFHPEEDLPAIMAIPDQVRQVALNLLMNAVEAMPNGGKLTVNTQRLQNAQEIMLSVTDTGEGISPDIMPNIFDPFITNKKRGTGIGLTISHDIVLKHRGRISAENNSDYGATFKVWLPIRPIPAEIE